MAAADSPLFRFQLWRTALPPALRLLHTVNLASYLLFVVLGMASFFGGPPIESVLRWLWLPATPAGIAAAPWTPLTYAFTNAYLGFFGLISFAFGFYWLNWIGRDYEETYGSHRLFAVYVAGALGGALLAVALGALLPTAPLRPYFGLWTPVTAVLCALATLHPDRQVGLFLLGVVSFKWIAIGFVVLSLAFSGDLTVLGAALAGYAFARVQRSGRDPGAWAAPLFGQRRPKKAATATAGRRPFARSSGSSGTDRRPAASGPLDVDAILDKILERGYESLTAEEREALDRASRD